VDLEKFRFLQGKAQLSMKKSVVYVFILTVRDEVLK